MKKVIILHALILWSVSIAFNVHHRWRIPYNIERRKVKHDSIKNTISYRSSFREMTSITTLPCLAVSGNTSVYVILGLLTTIFGGRFLEKMFKLNGIGAAPVFTLLLASLWSNSNIHIKLPVSHPLYDFCWTNLLPLSLSLLLLTPNVDFNKIDIMESDSSERINETILNVGVPFILGSLGSVIGCIISFFLSTILSQHHSALSFTRLSIEHAVIAAGCITSSYIGGSINFFTTAKILESRLGVDSPSLLSSLAAVDLFLMAIYFSILSICHSIKWLHTIFSSENVIKHNKHLDKSSVIQTDVLLGMSDQELKFNDDHMGYINVLSSVYITFALLIVKIGNWIEKNTSVPGISCLIIAILSYITSNMPMKSKHIPNRVKIIVCSKLRSLSRTLFCFLYASVGASAVVHDALETGPASFAFASLSLIIHFILIIFFSRLYNAAVSQTRKVKVVPLRQVSLIEVLIASNCNIGGSATAAAFAGSLSNNRALIIAATLWGCFGYSIGTTAGVYLATMLFK